MTAPPLKVIMIHPTAPREILEVLAEYLRSPTGSALRYVHCASVEVGIHFAEASLVKGRADPNPWLVQIPVSYILAILDMSKRAQAPGFLSAET